MSYTCRHFLTFIVALFVLNIPANAALMRTANITRLNAQAAEFSSYVLPNGFKIILVPFPSASNARIELLVKTGSKFEGYGETGMAHLLEHMLFKSAGKRANLKSDLTAIGAEWNGTTDADRTNFFETVAADPEKIDEAIRIEADRFIRASFTKEHLASEMTVVRNELEQSDNDPDSVLMRALQRQSFFWHGYSRPTIGARSDIEDASFGALQSFHKKHYRPDNAALIVSGNFDVRRVLALTSRQFSVARNPATPKVISRTRDEARATTSRNELFLPAGKTKAASAWKLSGFTDPQTYAFDLAAKAICDDDLGSLRKDLVLERKIALHVSCGTHIQPDYSLFTATATADKDADVDTLSNALHGHIEAVASKGISQEELDRIRLNLLTAYERLENSHEMLALFFSASEVAGDWRLYFWQRDTVKNVTLETVNAALKKWAVGVNRSDALLHNAEGVIAAEFSKSTDAQSLVSGKYWPAISKTADPLPNSAEELAKATVNILLDGTRARAALISRQTMGNLAWVVLKNDYGNDSALSGRKTACSMADSLMSYGGAGLNKAELSEKLEALQAYWSLGLGGLVVEAPRQNIDAALEILLAAWVSPALPEIEFDRIKTNRIAGIEENSKNSELVASISALMRFDNYPEQHPLKVRSFEQQLAENRAVSFADATACFSDFSGIANVRLAMMGTFTPQDVQLVWSKIASLPAAKISYQRVKNLEAPLEVDTTLINVSMPKKPNAAIAGLTLLRVTDDAPDFPALRIAVNVLGGDADSRVWKRLREHEGLSYSADVELSGNHFEPRSRFRIQASAASDRADVALGMLKDELARALKDGFTVREVERSKRAWLRERTNSLRDEQSFANTLAEGMLSGRDYAWVAQYDAKITQLTAKQVTFAFRKYLANAPIVWMIGR